MFKQSLGFKIIVLVGIVLIGAFTIFVYTYLKVEEKQMLAKSKRMAELLARAIHESLSEAMLAGKTDKVQKMIESYGPIEEIDKIRIFNPENGSILVDADKANIGSVIDQRDRFLLASSASKSELFSEGEKRVLSVVTPILNEPKCYGHQCHEPQKQILGALDIDISVMDTFEDIAKNRFRMIGFAILTVGGISLIIALLIIRLVNRPIKELVTTMRKVESGDLTAEANIASRDELGRLGRSFNSMTARLRGEIERLEILHETAEDFRSTIDLDEIERIVIQGIIRGLKFERAVLLLVNEEEQTLEGKMGIGVVEDVVERVKIPLDREYGILAETVLDAKPFNVKSRFAPNGQNGIYDMSLTPEKTVKCWEFHQCGKVDCPAHNADDLRCWLQSKTHCYDNAQMNFEDKAEVCCRCPVIQEAYGKKAILVLLMFGSEAFATVPLMAQDKVTGVIMVDNLRTQRPITDEDIKGLSVFAAQAGMTIENARLYEKLEGRIEEADEELKQQMADLIKMRNFNDSILQNISNGLVTTDMEGKIDYFNSAAEAILGYRAHEVQGQPIKDVLSDLAPLFSKTLRANPPIPPLEKGGLGGFAFHEITICTKAGWDIPIEASTSLLKNDAGETTGVVGIFTDLTERKEMEEQIRRADKLAALGQLASGIAHEIRNPLAGISGAAQILKDETPETNPHWEILNEIVERINTLETSISDFLRFARPAPLQLSPTDVNEVIQSVIPGLPSSPELAKELKGQIVIRISDTGVGIPPEKRDQIFNPYFTTKSEGTGLGLSIAQRIIEEHGGSISVESEVGKGTTFTLRIKN